MGRKAGYPRGTQLAAATHGSWHSLLAPGRGCKVQIALAWFGCPERAALEGITIQTTRRVLDHAVGAA